MALVDMTRRFETVYLGGQNWSGILLFSILRETLSEEALEPF